MKKVLLQGSQWKELSKVVKLHFLDLMDVSSGLFMVSKWGFMCRL